MNAPPDTAADETSEYYSWELPDGPARVRVSAEAIERILIEGIRGMGLLPKRGAEVGGVLLGTVGTGGTASVTIDDVVPVPIEYAFGPGYSLSEKDKDNLREVLRGCYRSPGRTVYAVGFYRTQTREGLSLTPEDLQLLSEYFPDPSSVVLLIRPQAMGPSVAGLFFREDGEVRAEPNCLEFPSFRGRMPRRREPDSPLLEPLATTPPIDDIRLPSFLGGPPPLETKEAESETAHSAARKQPFWISWWIQLPILTGLLLVDGFMGFIAAAQVNPAPVKAQVQPENPYALSLLVLEYGKNLHVTWNRKALALATAEKAVLSIVDGGQSRSLDLSVQQLRHESVTYHRLSDQVTLRLEVLLKGKRSVSESWDLNGPVR